tara:strand:- start:484 stop:636 length:153 start_codon:yes stop_codon:yes gene_type:complete
MGTVYSNKDAKQIQIIKTAVLKIKAKHKQKLRNKIEDKLIMLRMKQEWLI